MISTDRRRLARSADICSVDREWYISQRQISCDGTARTYQAAGLVTVRLDVWMGGLEGGWVAE